VQRRCSNIDIAGDGDRCRNKIGGEHRRIGDGICGAGAADVVAGAVELSGRDRNRTVLEVGCSRPMRVCDAREMKTDEGKIQGRAEERDCGKASAANVGSARPAASPTHQLLEI